MIKVTTRYPVEPVSKPRMTQRDKWQKRPAVLRYRAYCDHLRLLKVQVPLAGGHLIFVLPMPKSWSKKKRREMLGQPHEQKPDAKARFVHHVDPLVAWLIQLGIEPFSSNDDGHVSALDSVTPL